MCKQATGHTDDINVLQYSNVKIYIFYQIFNSVTFKSVKISKSRQNIDKFVCCSEIKANYYYYYYFCVCDLLILFFLILISQHMRIEINFFFNANHCFHNGDD